MKPTSLQQQKTSDPHTIYPDIIDMLHHEPDPIKHPRMSLYKRAAQFAPFAALSGYDEMVSEETRHVETDHQRELGEDEERVLNQQLRRLIELTEAGEHPTVNITYYEPDKRKNGGKYVTIIDDVKRVDTVNQVIEMMSMEGFLNKAIAIKQITDISPNLA